MRKIIFATFFLLILSAHVLAESNNILKEYAEHIFRIGVAEENAGNLLLEYAVQIENLSVPKNGINKFKDLAKIFKENLREHEALLPPNNFFEFHELWSKILKARIGTFNDLSQGLREKKIDLVKEAFELIELVEDDMNKAEEIGKNFLKEVGGEYPR